MQRTLFTQTELRLATERRLKYQGVAKISLDQLHFDPNSSRELDSKNLERLNRIFRKEGCRRLIIENHVPAIVSWRHVETSLRRAKVSARALLTSIPEQYPHLKFEAGQVQCLHGLHRIKVGGELLPPSDRWWTVDLYLDGMNSLLAVLGEENLTLALLDIGQELRTTLIEEYSNERTPGDGEIYRKLRQYQGEHNSRFQNRWWSWLSLNKSNRLRQLFKHVELSAAFDALLGIPGLWGGMRIGMVHKVMGLKCDEVGVLLSG